MEHCSNIFDIVYEARTALARKFIVQAACAILSSFKRSIEISRLNGLDYLSSNMMKIAGVHYWKHGKKGLAVFWLKQARDEVRLNRIAKQLYDFVGKSVSDESFKLWEEMIELLGNEPGTAGGLEFLKKYKDFRQSLQQVQEGITTDDTLKASEALISLMRNPSTPQQFWLPLLYDSLKLDWHDCPLFNVSQTNLLLNKLHELSQAKLLPGFMARDCRPRPWNLFGWPSQLTSDVQFWTKGAEAKWEVRTLRMLIY